MFLGRLEFESQSKLRAVHAVNTEKGKFFTSTHSIFTLFFYIFVEQVGGAFCYHLYSCYYRDLLRYFVLDLKLISL